MSLQMEKQSKKLFLSQGVFWLSVALLFLLVIAFLIPVQANDFWWYMRVARDALAEGAIPQVDALSFTHAGNPIVYHSWLSAMIYYLAFQFGGLAWIVVLRVIFVTATLVILWYLIFRTGLDPILSAGILLIAGLASANNWGVIRPQLFILPLFLLTFWVLERWGENDNRNIWLLPLIGIFWVNLHGSFILIGFLVIPALIFGRGDRKPLLFAFISTVLLFALNPRGFAVWDYVWETLTLSSSQSVSYEWGPPVNDNWQMNLFFAWLLLFAPLAAFSPSRLSRLDWVWFLGFGWMALSGMRYVIWLTFFLAIWTARLLEPLNLQPSKYIRLRNAKLNFVLAGSLLLLLLFLIPGARDRWWEQAPSALPAATPVDAVAWLSQHPDLPGEMWNDLDFASYLTYMLPERPIWIDLRFEMLYDLNDWDEYRKVAGGDPGWDEVLQRDNVNLVFSSYSNDQLLSELQDSADWCRVYQDDVAFIFIHTLAAGTEACIDG